MNTKILRELPSLSFETGQEELDLLGRHNLYFETRKANTPALIEAAHALRYQVYCVECKFENPDEHIGGLEVDEFDSHSTHGLLFHRGSGEAIGTVRIILPNDDGMKDSLPILRLLRENHLDLADYLPVENAVEVSRFAISKMFRRRHMDDLKSLDLAGKGTRFERERQGALPSLSLIQFLLRQTVEFRVSYWTAVMEVKLLRMLAGMGIRFTPVGPVVIHHGLRQPCYCYVPSMLQTMRDEHPDYWNVITNGGELSQKLSQVIEGPVPAIA